MRFPLGHNLLLWSILCACLSADVYAQHGSWQDRYTGVHQAKCCGERDCLSAPVRLHAQTATSVTVEVAGTIFDLPGYAVHVSEDDRSYVCLFSHEGGIAKDNVRCVFYSIGA